MDRNLEQNKETAKRFYAMAFNDGEPREAVEKYTGDYYRQHNPHVGDGKENFIKYFADLARDYPDKRIHFKREIAEDNYVVLHTFQEWPGDDDYATIDIFGFDDNGKIIEHWDVLQPIPVEFAHDNGMF